MARTDDGELRQFWNSARQGTLTPWSLAKVWALHTVSETKGLALQHLEIAQLVTKVGGGHPSGEAIRQLREQFAEDQEWYPGTGVETGKRPGPKPSLMAAAVENVGHCAIKLQLAPDWPVGCEFNLIAEPLKNASFRVHLSTGNPRVKIYKPGATVLWESASCKSLEGAGTFGVRTIGVRHGLLGRY